MGGGVLARRATTQKKYYESGQSGISFVVKA
jgi:hypothetical protein